METCWRLREADSGKVIIPRLEVATNFWGRLIGLQFRSQLPIGHGLLLAPCNGIHTFFVRFPIDVTFLDEHGYVLQKKPRVRPWRVVLPVRNARAVLETAAGDASWALGIRVALVAPPSSVRKLPKVLRTWVCGDE